MFLFTTVVRFDPVNPFFKPLMCVLKVLLHVKSSTLQIYCSLRKDAKKAFYTKFKWLYYS